MQEITYSVPADKCGLVIGKGEHGLQYLRTDLTPSSSSAGSGICPPLPQRSDASATPSLTQVWAFMWWS